jgi:predicted restriction endonuclease
MNIIKSSTIKKFIEDNLRNYNYMDLFILLTNKYYHIYEDIEMVFLIEYDFIPKKYNVFENRKYQSMLRNYAINKYKKCVISGKTNVLLLEAAHVKQVYECVSKNEKSDVHNILLLWIDLHKFFDKYLISINPVNLSVEISNQVVDPDIIKYNGIIINNITKETIKYLEHHYYLFKIANVSLDI